MLVDLLFVDLSTSPLLQLALVALSVTLVVVSLALIAATRKARHVTDIEAAFVTLTTTTSTSSSAVVRLPSPLSCSPDTTAPRGSAPLVPLPTSRRFKTRAASEVYLPANSHYDQQKLVEMLKAKRVRLSPEVHSARKFALVNCHIRNVFREHRRYTQLPTFAQAAGTLAAPLPSATGLVTGGRPSAPSLFNRHAVAVSCA